MRTIVSAPGRHTREHQASERAKFQANNRDAGPEISEIQDGPQAGGWTQISARLPSGSSSSPLFRPVERLGLLWCALASEPGFFSAPLPCALRVLLR
jgi:hypothetical protein